MTLSRRDVLAGISVAVTGAIAGCLGDDEATEVDEIYWDDTPEGVNRDDISTPTVIFAFDWNQEEGTVRVRHTGGRNVPVDRIFIQGEGISEEYNRVNIADLPGSELSAGESFTSGAGIDVELVADEFRVEVVWVDEDTNVAVTMDQFAVGLEES